LKWQIGALQDITRSDVLRLLAGSTPKIKRSADLVTAQEVRTIGLEQESQFWEDFKICLVIRKVRELSSLAANPITSKWSPNLGGWNGMLIR
jgi:hypothetical protein